jgi:hypothetical protein
MPHDSVNLADAALVATDMSSFPDSNRFPVESSGNVPTGRSLTSQEAPVPTISSPDPAACAPSPDPATGPSAGPWGPLAPACGPSAARRRAAALAAVVLAGALLASCHPASRATAGRGASPGAPLAVGPGPQPAYRVQPQPAPGSCHYRYESRQPLPDVRCTPGAINPRVTQATLDTTICQAGYASDIRPPVDITAREKRANARSYRYTGPLHDVEYDHLVALELGGDPNDPRNLWVEPPSPGHRPGSAPYNDKDRVANALHTAVCARRVRLAAAQLAIARDWTTAERDLGLDHST